LTSFLSRAGPLRQSQLHTTISLNPDHIFAWNSHGKDRKWCREDTSHGIFSKIYTLRRPNRSLNTGRSKPPRVRRGQALGNAPRARSHAPPPPRALGRPRAHTRVVPASGYKARPHARPSPLLPPPHRAQLSRASPQLRRPPKTRQSRPRAPAVAKPFSPTSARSEPSDSFLERL
jgi:hypothetical protein